MKTYSKYLIKLIFIYYKIGPFKNSRFFFKSASKRLTVTYYLGIFGIPYISIYIFLLNYLLFVVPWTFLGMNRTVFSNFLVISSNLWNILACVLNVIMQAALQAGLRQTHLVHCMYGGDTCENVSPCTVPTASVNGSVLCVCSVCVCCV